MPRRVRPAVPAFVAVAGALLLTGCHTPGGAVKQTITVQFITYDSSAAKPVIVAACGHLPGETVDPGRAGDPNLILDVTHATPAQQAAIGSCLDGLQSAQPGLKIRTVSYDNGIDN